MARRKRRNPWVATGEVLLWVLFATLMFPIGFAGWAVGHYTSLGKSGGTTTVTRTVTRTMTTTAATTTAATSTAATTTTAAATTTATTAAATTTATTTAASTAGNAANGKTVFADNACASCHTFKAAGATGTVGPDLDTAVAADAQKAGMSLDAFVRQSIVEPDAYVPQGYPKGVMPTSFGTSLSKTQLDDLVAFIVSGAK